MVELSQELIFDLIDEAKKAREMAYAPYSGFRVGACVLAESGIKYSGCNVENASYGACVCAERTALFNAVCSGERSFTALSVVSDSEDITFPCGICRQTLSEFVNPDMPIICCDKNGAFSIFTMKELMPHSFTKENMK